MNNDYGCTPVHLDSALREHMGRYMPSTMYRCCVQKIGENVEGYIKREFPVFAIAELQMENYKRYLGKSGCSQHLAG